ncbi:hypothetical protein LX36DRAFT_403637 [Colletotrichum falcatum]|nr:hypothetical protein LX36DRAFT_403637 [Colletotrichum falcatum]
MPPCRSEATPGEEGRPVAGNPRETPITVSLCRRAGLGHWERVHRQALKHDDGLLHQMSAALTTVLLLFSKKRCWRGGGERKKEEIKKTVSIDSV